jgi:hypothetical protein
MIDSDEPSLPDAAVLRRAVEEGLRRYFSSRRDRVDDFIARHFSLRGAAGIHRRAFGFDVLRAPLNLALAGPQVGLKLAGKAAKRAGRERLARMIEQRDILLATDVGREIEWLLRTELFELPYQDGERIATRDALAETILADPAIALPLAAALCQQANDPAFRTRLEEATRQYLGSRAAAADITTSLAVLGAGAVTVKQLTPGVVSLAAPLASLLAQQSAIAAFPLGTGLGALWYGLFPAAPSALLIGGLTGGLFVAATAVAAFAGVVADPVQKRLGLHRRRLLRMIDRLERQAFDPAAPAFAVRDHYVARLLDLFDLLGSAYRLARS